VPRRKIYLFESAEMTAFWPTNSATFLRQLLSGRQAGPPCERRHGDPHPSRARLAAPNWLQVAYADTPSRGGLAHPQLMGVRATAR